MRELTPLEYLQVQAKKSRAKLPKPDRIEPDAYCYAYERPKSAFFTEGKAYQALTVSQQRRLAEGSPRQEERFYRCPFGRGLSRLNQVHFHLTSMKLSEYAERFPDEAEEAPDVYQD